MTSWSSGSSAGWKGTSSSSGEATWCIASRGSISRSWSRTVIGNHEVALLEGERSATHDVVRRQLGASLGQWLAWLGSRPFFIREDGYILVHAGIAPGKRPEQCTRSELTEIRTVDGRPWFDFWPGPETVIFGHWAQRGKVDLPLCKGLDTGCVYGGRLTGLWWPRLEWVSVPARRRWFERAGPASRLTS